MLETTLLSFLLPSPRPAPPCYSSFVLADNSGYYDLSYGLGDYLSITCTSNNSYWVKECEKQENNKWLGKKRKPISPPPPPFAKIKLILTHRKQSQTPSLYHRI